jgi:hypothetical protein
MSTPLRSMLLGLLFLAAGGCATAPTFRTNYDHSADFSSYHTFGYFETLGTDAAGYESLVTQALKDATRREMEARGYTYAATGADLLLNFNARLARHTKVTQYAAPVYYGYRVGYYGGWGGYQTYVDQYTEGTLNVDIVDAARKQLVWEGVAIGRVTEEHRQNREAAINTAVSELFARYPFRAGQAAAAPSPTPH